MTENKRFTLEMQYWKGNPQGRKLFDNLTGQDGMSVEELCNIASDLHSKCEELESVLKVYEDCLGKLEDENKELKDENEQLKSTNMEMEDYLGRLEEEKIKLEIKLQKIRDYAKEDGEVKQGIIEKVVLE